MNTVRVSTAAAGTSVTSLLLSSNQTKLQHVMCRALYRNGEMVQNPYLCGGICNDHYPDIKFRAARRAF